MPFAHRAVLEASAAASRRGDAAAVLALVLETEGSTYVRSGAAALFGVGEESIGWLSGGCLEPEIARHAAEAARESRLGWLELDTREDEDLLDGSALGCRGRLRLALLPLRALGDWHVPIDAWFAQPVTLILSLSERGALRMQVGDRPDAYEWLVSAPACPWLARAAEWDIPFATLSRVALFGAGPETPVLLPLLRTLGWKTLMVERRARWRTQATLADVALELSPPEALAHEALRGTHAALVMHHHFEFDRAALEALAASEIGFVGLLGPQRRREDLFRLLPASVRESLQPRLRSPVGLDLGGQGAEAIALSIAAQLQQFRHGA
jgi:xanthine dehydrogenase accessory factor